MDIHDLIIHVDDDQAMLDIVGHLLPEFPIIGCKSYEEFCLEFLTWKPSIVICDYDIGINTGIDCAKFVKSHQPDTKVIMFSSETEFNDDWKCYDYAVEKKHGVFELKDVIDTIYETL